MRFLPYGCSYLRNFKRKLTLEALCDGPKQTVPQWQSARREAVTLRCMPPSLRSGRSKWQAATERKRRIEPPRVVRMRAIDNDIVPDRLRSVFPRRISFQHIEHGWGIFPENSDTHGRFFEHHSLSLAIQASPITWVNSLPGHAQAGADVRHQDRTQSAQRALPA